MISIRFSPALSAQFLLGFPYHISAPSRSSAMQHLSENMCRSQEGRHLGASIHPVDLSSPANSRSLSRLFRGPLKPMAPLQLLCGTRMSVTTVLSHTSLTWSFSITGRGWCSYHFSRHSRSYFLLRFAQLFVTRSKDSVVPTTSLSSQVAFSIQSCLSTR